MTQEEILKRNKFAAMCESLAEFGKDVKSGGWDVPMNYIVHSLRDWAKCYGYPKSEVGEYNVFVYVDGWEQKPFSRKFMAGSGEEAVGMCRNSLKEDEHLFLKEDGSPFFTVEEEE